MYENKYIFCLVKSPSAELIHIAVLGLFLRRDVTF